MTIEFFTIDVSVRLSDRSFHREEQKKFVKSYHLWGLKPGPLDYEANALPTERQESVGQEISEVSFVCFMHYFTCWTLFISRINRA